MAGGAAGGDGSSAYLWGLLCPCSFSPCLLLVFTFLWSLVHRFLGPVLPLFFLPPASRAVHRAKLRRWKQLRTLLAASRTREEARKIGNARDNQRVQLQKQQQEPTQEQEEMTSSSPQQQQVLGKADHQQKRLSMQELHHTGGEDEQRQAAAQPTEDRETHTQRAKDREEVSQGQQQSQHDTEGKQALLDENSQRSSESSLHSTGGSTSNDHSWTLLSRDDATGAALDDEWEGNAGLRKRLVAGNGEGIGDASRTANSSKEGAQTVRGETAKAECGYAEKCGAAEADTSTGRREEEGEEEEQKAARTREEHGGKAEEGLAAAASSIVAAAAEEGAAAVARENAEAAATARGEEEETAQEGKQTKSEEEELELLQSYFVTSNANVVGTLHALYLAPTALYYSIRNVVLPAAELVIAERAAAAAKPEAAASSHAVASATSEQLFSYRRLRDLMHIYFLHWEKAPSFWDGSSDCIVILSAYVMASYFVWDTIECFQNLKFHGRAFFFHALLSLLAGILQVSARGIRLAGICSMFAVSEMSTPFLHFRWFLIHNGQGSSRLCTLTTLWTVFLFILVRAIMVPCLVFSHYWADIVFFHEYTLNKDARISALRALFMLALTVAWTALNLFWCFLFFRSLFKRRNRSSHPGAKRKPCVTGCSAARKGDVRPSSTPPHMKNT